MAEFIPNQVLDTVGLDGMQALSIGDREVQSVDDQTLDTPQFLPTPASAVSSTETQSTPAMPSNQVSTKISNTDR